MLYGFKEDFLNGNTEIIILEDYFAAVCYHTKHTQYDVTLPIGFITHTPKKVREIFHLVQSYLDSSLYDNKDESGKKGFGKLVKTD